MLFLCSCDPGLPTLGDATPPETAPEGESATDSPADTGETGPRPDDGVYADLRAVVDPEVTTLLRVTWTQLAAAEATWLEFSVGDEPPMASPPRGGEVGAHAEVILGVPAETKVSWRVGSVIDGATVWSATVATRTGSLPPELPSVDVLRWDPTLASGERWLLGSVDEGTNWYQGPFWAFLLDREGRYVWYHEIPDGRLALYVQVAASGDHVFMDGSTQYVWDDSVAPLVTRRTLDGGWSEEVELSAYGFAVEERGDGAILYEHRSRGAFTLHAWLDGEDEELWSCTAYMASIGQGRAACNPNTIVGDAERETILWSMYTVDTVLEVDLASGAAIRQFGQLDGGWAFDPEGSVVDYQHYVNWSPTGTILASTHVLAESGVQVCNEYAVDDAAATLRLAWQYESPDYYAQYGGECYRLGGGNTLVGYGVDGAVVEVTPAGEVAWELTWDRSDGTHLVGHMEFVDDLYALNGG